MNGNSVNTVTQNNKGYFPTYDFYTNTVNDANESKDSIISEGGSPLKRKLLSTNEDSHVILNKSSFHTNKNYIVNSMTKSNISIANSSIKPQQYSHFFGQRNSTKNQQNEAIPNAKHMGASKQNFNKMKLSQVVENDLHSAKNRTALHNVNNNKLKSHTYSGEKRRQIGKVNNFMSQERSQNSTVFETKSRIARAAATTYGSGGIRTNTSAGARWNRNSGFNDKIDTATHNMKQRIYEKSETRDSTMNLNKNTASDVSERTSFADKNHTEKAFIKTMTKTSHKLIKAKYGDQDMEVNQMTNIWKDHPVTRNTLTTKNSCESEQTYFTHADLSNNHKGSASVTKLKTEVREDRREEKYLESSPVPSQKALETIKELGSASTNKTSKISSLNPINSGVSDSLDDKPKLNYCKFLNPCTRI